MCHSKKTTLQEKPLIFWSPNKYKVICEKVISRDTLEFNRFFTSRANNYNERKSQKFLLHNLNNEDFEKFYLIV